MSTPSRWLVEHRELLASLARGGRALDVACGLGRNALFLAALGFGVDAVDVDGARLAVLLRTAGERGLPIRAIQADVTEIELARGSYDVIVNVNFLERSLYPRLRDALAPNGVLLFETFTRDHVAALGSHMNPAYLLEPNELLHAFGGLRILHYRERVLDEDPPRAVASLVARLSSRAMPPAPAN